jgi:hypothetical protein
MSLPDERSCKWCQRSSRTSNPLLYEHAVYPYLRWRRQFGRECNHCPWVLELHYKDEDKSELLTKFESNPEELALFIKKLEDWEVDKVRTGGKRALYGTSAASRSTAPKQDVSAFASESLEFRKLLGYIWTVKMYSDTNGAPPPKKIIKTFTIAGQKVRGVLMPETEKPQPPGAVAMQSISKTGGAKTAQLVNTEDQDQHRLDETWNSVQKQNQFASKRASDKESQKIYPRARGKAGNYDFLRCLGVSLKLLVLFTSLVFTVISGFLARISCLPWPGQQGRRLLELAGAALEEVQRLRQRRRRRLGKPLGPKAEGFQEQKSRW